MPAVRLASSGKLYPAGKVHRMVPEAFIETAEQRDLGRDIGRHSGVGDLLGKAPMKDVQLVVRLI